ncbi:MAG: sensor histidine kinase [Terriglobales bacterium]
MLSLGKTPRFLRRLGAPVDREEHRRIERVLATARVFLAFAAMVAIYLDPTEPTRYSRLAYVLLFAYIVYSAGVWAVLRRFQELTPSFVWMHAVDMLFPAVFTLFTEGPNSPFFLFFVFVLTAAAFRWGFLETMLTSSIISVFILVEAVLLTYGRHIGTWLEGEYEINRLVIRLSYLLILGVLLGYLAETEKELRAENAFITRMIGKARVDSGLRGTMQGVLGETMRLFLAPRALAVLQQANSGRMFLWQSQSRANGENSILSSEVGPEDRARYKVPLPASALFWEKTGLWGIGGDGRRSRIDASWSPVALPQVGSAASILAVTLHMGEEWSGCLLLYDARTGGDKLQELRFAQKLFRQMGPAIYTVYLLRRLRSRAGAIERARVARELHDGAIQALIAVEMEVDVLRRGASRSQNSSLEARLERIQEMLRDQVFDLRTLMQQMKPVEFSPSQLLDHMADVVERFRRDTGISAEFVSSLEDVALSPRVCRELVRITQEALANVRKHSGAQRVLVRFGMRDSNWTLGVEDDGRGFAFAGKKFLSELDACREGPEIIKERVRVLGGQLEIESLPGKGTRLEVTFPQKAQATYV